MIGSLLTDGATEDVADPDSEDERGPATTSILADSGSGFSRGLAGAAETLHADRGEGRRGDFGCLFEFGAVRGHDGPGSRSSTFNSTFNFA